MVLENGDVLKFPMDVCVLANDYASSPNTLSMALK